MWFEFPWEQSRWVYLYEFDANNQGKDWFIQYLCQSRVSKEWQCIQHFGGSNEQENCWPIVTFHLSIPIAISNCYVSLRRASEWGMRGLQGSFLRFKKQLPSDKSKRKNIIQSIVLVHNFCTEIMGCGQINAVFDPEYEWVIVIAGNDRINHYYYHELS